MCTFVDKMVDLGLQKGKQQGIQVLVKTCQRLHLSIKETRVQIMEGFSMSEKEAEQKLTLYWDSAIQ